MPRSSLKTVPLIPLTTPLSSSTFNSASETDVVEQNAPHISDLIVSHHDCFNHHRLCQFSRKRVQLCAQASSSP